MGPTRDRTDDEVRNDVIGALALAVLDQRVLPSEIPARVKEYIASFYKAFSKFDTVSLDTPVPGSEKGDTWVSPLVDERTVDD